MSVLLFVLRLKNGNCSILLEILHLFTGILNSVLSILYVINSERRVILENAIAL
jgi:hypothetical protein